MNRLQQLIDDHRVVLLDGAMGTTLMAAGLDQGAPPEAWNVEHPEQVRAVHREFIAAGAQVTLTNTFGGTRFRLKLHKLEDRVIELNRAAAELARAEAAAALHPVVVAGSMGPTGELLDPLGTMTFEEAQDAFAEQAAGLAAGGVDVLWIETMSDLEEVRAAVSGARRACNLPVVATMSFDTSGRTMMGVTAGQALETMRGFDLLALGANCGNNLLDTEAAIGAMHAADPGVTLVVKANAGIPRWEGSDLVYDGTPEVMAGYAVRARELGARLIGGCCGTGPAHIRAMAAALGDPAFQAAPAVRPSRNGGRDEKPATGRQRSRRRSRE